MIRYPYRAVVTVLTLLTILLLTLIVAQLAGAQPSDRLWRYPAVELSAADACYVVERDAREIPGEPDAYRAWWDAADAAARADWSAAYDACQAAHLTTGRWDWSRLVLVSGGAS